MPTLNPVNGCYPRHHQFRLVIGQKPWDFVNMEDGNLEWCFVFAISNPAAAEPWDMVDFPHSTNKRGISFDSASI